VWCLVRVQVQVQMNSGIVLCGLVLEALDVEPQEVSTVQGFRQQAWY